VAALGQVLRNPRPDESLGAGDEESRSRPPVRLNLHHLGNYKACSAARRPCSQRFFSGAMVQPPVWRRGLGDKRLTRGFGWLIVQGKYESHRPVRGVTQARRDVGADERRRASAHGQRPSTSLLMLRNTYDVQKSPDAAWRARLTMLPVTAPF